MSQGVSDSSMKDSRYGDVITEDELVCFDHALDRSHISILSQPSGSREHRPKSVHVSSMLLKPFQVYQHDPGHNGRVY